MSSSDSDSSYPLTQVPTGAYDRDDTSSPVPTERNFPRRNVPRLEWGSSLHINISSSDIGWQEYDVKNPCFMAGSVKEVPLKYFKESLLPPLREGLSVHAVSRKLELDPVNDQTTKRAPWAKLMKLAEAVAECGQQILEEANGPVVEPTALFMPCSPVSEESGQTSKQCFTRWPMKPSSCVVLKENHDATSGVYTPDWADIAVLGCIAHDTSQYRHDAEVREMNTRIVTSMMTIMRNTPHRRFVYAYSVDRTRDSESMRLWFLSHSDILVSKPFNCRTTHLPFLIHFFLSMQFATQVELGYDTTMTIFDGPAARDLEREESDFYDISFHAKPDEDHDSKTRTFRTVELMSGLRVKDVFSASTRVWIGLELGEDGKPFGEPVTIKDYWVQDKLRREGDTLADIREAAKKSGNAEYIRIIEDHLAQVVCHGDVYIDGVHDNTMTALRRGCPLPQDLGSFSLAEGQDDSDAHCFLKSNTEQTTDELESLSHYRIVYKGIGQTLDRMIYMHDLLKSLPQALESMSTIHALGYLHGDISPANMLLINDGKVALTGLTYAHKMNEETVKRQWAHEETLLFTPYEVLEQEYKLLPRPPTPTQKPDRSPYVTPAPVVPPPFSFPPGYLENEDGDNVEDPLPEPIVPRATTPPVVAPSLSAESDLPPFRYNVLHDFESFWWTSLYLLAHREIASSKLSQNLFALYGHNGNKRITVWLQLFGQLGRPASGDADHEARQYFLEDDEGYHSKIRYLFCALRLAGEEFDKVRKSLVAAYTKAEEDVTKIDMTSAAGLQDEFNRALQALLEVVTTKKTIVFGPIEHLSEPKGRPVLEARIEMIRWNKSADDLKWEPQAKEEESETEGYDYLNEAPPTPGSSQDFFKRRREDDEEDEQWEGELPLPPSGQGYPAPYKKRRLSLDDLIATPSPRASPSPKLTPTKSSQVIPTSQDSEVEPALGVPQPAPSQVRKKRRSRLERWGSERSLTMQTRSRGPSQN